MLKTILPSSRSGPTTARSIRYGLAFALLLVLLAAFCGIIALRSYRLAVAFLHPPRKPVVLPDKGSDLAGLETVSFKTSDALTLRGWYIPSKNKAAVIMVHGFGENRAAMLFEERLLARQGYGVLAFDSRAHGESDGTIVTWGDQEPRDVAAALDFVSARPEVDPRRIGAIGFSVGGLAVARAAVQDHRLAAIVIEGTEPSMKDDLWQEEFRKWEPLSGDMALWAFHNAGVDTNAVRPVDNIALLSPRPVLFIYGSRDSVPLAFGQRFYQAARQPKQFWIAEGAEHGGYAKAAPEEYRQQLTGFFRKALRVKPAGTVKRP